MQSYYVGRFSDLSLLRGVLHSSRRKLEKRVLYESINDLNIILDSPREVVVSFCKI